MPEAPKPTDTKPVRMELEPGTYWWCSCGKSNNQPFCDGSHQGSEFSPVEVNITEKKKYGLCGCKQSANQPMCDGSHNNID
jgi:CDGSH-type Zn-finger protein